MRGRSAFTLLEMLVVLAISAILLTLLSHLLADSIIWGRLGYEEEAISDQLQQALDLIEQDVRAAVDVDVDYFARVDSRALSAIRTSYELRLVSVDEGDERALGLVVYSLRSATNELSLENPKERPRQGSVLYRAQDDSLHSGNYQPLAMYLSSLHNTPKGFQVYYYGADGRPCSLADDIYSLEVCLAGRTKRGAVVSASRLIPLVAKFE